MNIYIYILYIITGIAKASEDKRPCLVIYALQALVIVLTTLVECVYTCLDVLDVI